MMLLYTPLIMAEIFPVRWRNGACAPLILKIARAYSFRSQRNDRIHPAGAPRREPGRQDGDDGKKQADGEIGLRVERRNAEKKAADHAGRRGDRERSHRDSDAKKAKT